MSIGGGVGAGPAAPPAPFNGGKLAEPGAGGLLDGAVGRAAGGAVPCGAEPGDWNG